MYPQLPWMSPLAPVRTWNALPLRCCIRSWSLEWSTSDILASSRNLTPSALPLILGRREGGVRGYKGSWGGRGGREGL